MKNKSISRMLMVASPMMVVCVVLALGASAVAQEPIQGSWILTISPLPGFPAPFSAVASFAAGGVFVATGENDRINPVSELHGSWQRTTGNQYGSTAYFFAFDPTGHAVGLLKTNQTFELTSRNGLIGLLNLSSCDLHGENCTLLPGVAPITGKRMIVENLPTL